MKRYGYFLDLLKLDIEKYPVIAVVGGGGKTSLIYRLNEELQALGKKVIISTTTHMAYDPMLPLVKSTDLEQVSEMLKEHGFAAVADIEETSGKMCAIEEAALKKLVRSRWSETKTLEGSSRLGTGNSGFCRRSSKCDRSGLSWQTHLRDRPPCRIHQLFS